MIFNEIFLCLIILKMHLTKWMKILFDFPHNFIFLYKCIIFIRKLIKFHIYFFNFLYFSEVLSSWLFTERSVLYLVFFIFLLHFLFDFFFISSSNVRKKFKFYLNQHQLVWTSSSHLKIFKLSAFIGLLLVIL